MDLKGSLVDTYLKIFPTESLLVFLKTITEDDIPTNILKAIGKDATGEPTPISSTVQFTNKDFENINKIKEIVNDKFHETDVNKIYNEESKEGVDSKTDEGIEIDDKPMKSDKKPNESDQEAKDDKVSNKEELQATQFLTTLDIDWLYNYLQKCKSSDKDVPYLHDLLLGANIEVPENKVIKRNPVLEARCVKLRAQQEAREYRKMTKTVDNVRLKFPEDSISYQMKQLNRQLIAIGQFIISIFAGFLFGFRGVEWMVGNLDFGFRLLLGVMCALVIALAEIYFLAKKLNEELNIPETTQLGGPVKFADENKYMDLPTKKAVEKEHQD